jgi:hypothetical protein
VPKQLSIGALPSDDYSIELRSTEPLIGFAQQFPFRLMDWIIPAAQRAFAVIGGSVLAAADALLNVKPRLGMVDQARRRLLPLDGHGQGCDGQFGLHVVMHRPANDFAGEEIEHDGQIEVGCYHTADDC